MNGYQQGQADGYQPSGQMDSNKRYSGYQYQWDRNAESSDKYPNGPLPEGVGSEEFDKKQTCCRRFVGHPKGVGIVLILIGGLAIITQITATALGAYLSQAVAGIWTGLVFICAGAFGIAFSNKKTKLKLLIYTTLSHVSILLALLLIGFSIGGVMEDWKLTDGCGGYSWRRWFDSECVEPQAKIGLHITLATCAFAGLILSIYNCVGTWYHMGWCGRDAGFKERSTPVPYVWTGSLQRNGSLSRQYSAPVKPIYTGALTSAKRPRLSTSSQKSNPDAETNEQLLAAAAEFQPRDMPRQQFILPYNSPEQYPEYEDQPFTPGPYMQHSTPTNRAPPMESDL